MYWFSMGVALLVAVGIIAIGIMYLLNPRAATQSFGLPLPEKGENIAWWLRLLPKSAFGIHGLTAALMIAAAIPHIMQSA